MMNNSNLVLGLAATVLLLTTGCPKQPDNAKETSAAPATQSATKPATEAKPASPVPADEAPADASAETLIKQTLNDMLEALNSKDLEAYTACFHPESGELEEMLGFFEGFDNTKQKVEFVSLSLEAMEGEKALVEYTMLIINQEDESDSAKESGDFELVLQDGNWLIVDLS